MAAISAEEKARTLEQCECYLDAAIERLNNLRLDDPKPDGEGPSPDGNGVQLAGAPAPAQTTAAVASAAETNLPVPSGGCGDNRTKWVEELIQQITSADDVHDARARAARLLESLERSVAAERDVAVWQSGVLKKAVLLQHRLHKAQEEENRELQRQVAACQERVRRLEYDNYALSAHIRQAQPKGGSMSGRFHPEVF
ncbi:uncharacterized protein LOC133904818 [Phragmites australis]|uniref:uncharacterized protein LOC133904818 n=1 Tax=Phragmites australis TaxID=29695 RepID=UPI002D76CBE5|nr:uncharacterized protein LOC133904818 [Phragmites australis]